MIRTRANNTNLNPIFRVPPRVPVHNIQTLTRVEVIDGTFVVNEERLFRHFVVDGAPPDVLGVSGVVDDTFVLG